MASCDEIDRLLTPYVDGEASAAEQREVDAHLRACAPCAGHAASERTGRRILQVKAQSLSVHAPGALRARCAALAPACRGQRILRAGGGWRSLVWTTASAAALLVAVVVVFGVVTHSPALLAAELTLDHLKCFALFEPVAAQPIDSTRLSASLSSEYGWHIVVPPSDGGCRVTLLGARKCLSTDGIVAHVLYRHAGHPLSLFVMRAGSRPPSELGMPGYVARLWSDATSTYVMLASREDRDAGSVAAHFGAR
jgi:anti-sigma factor RsiW